MSSTSSWSPAAVEKAVTASQESLEEAYVRLNTQLLLCLQRRDTDAALRTAEAIRDMLSSSPTVHQSDSVGGGGGSDSLPSSSAPFHGSPAEQLLQLREQLRTLASTESRRAHNNGSGEATTPDSSSSESGSDNEEDDEEDDDDEEEETSESEQYSDSVDDKDDDKGREKEGATVSSSDSNPSRQHQDQQAASHRIAEALIKLRHALPETTSDCPTQDSSALCGAAAAASSSSSLPKKTTKTRSSQPFELQPRPPPPRHRVDGGNKKNACSRKTGDDSAKRGVVCLQEPPHEGEGIEEDAGDRSQDAEADAVLWERMRAEVAEEMKRLAVVRKNR